MKNLFSKRIGAICLALIMILSIVGSMAYFSDYVATDVAGTAGTVAINMTSDINLLNDDGQDILNPGDMRDGSFEVENMGNKSIDVRTTIALTVESDHYDLVFSGDEATQSEFDLYLRSDVEYVEGEGWKPVAGATPIQVKSINGNVITYAIPEYSLNGNMDLMEFESVEGVLTDSHDYDFVVVFKGEAGNKWQDATITLNMIVEAKQHENTQAGWDVVAQETITNGSLNQDVVKGENILTETGNDSDANKGNAWFRVYDAEYFTLKEAIEAVEDGGTIEILGDAADANGNIYVNVDEIDAGGKNFTIVGPVDENGVSTPIEIHNAGTMTGFNNITSSNVTIKESGYAVYGYGDYYDLQAACDAAESGDIIYVMDDCYVPNAVTSKKELTFMPLNKDVTITVEEMTYITNLNIVGNNGYTITVANSGNGMLAFNNLVVGDGVIILGDNVPENYLLRLDPTNGSATGTATFLAGSVVGDTGTLIYMNTLQRLTINIEAGATIQNVSSTLCSRNCTKNIADGAIFNNVAGY